MPDRYDAVIIGAGPGGEVALNSLLKAGRRVALVENGVIGGECTNWGCIPSKTLLRATELAGQCERAAGVAKPTLDFDALAAYRDERRGGLLLREAQRRADEVHVHGSDEPAVGRHENDPDALDLAFCK